MTDPYFTDGSRLTLWHGTATAIAAEMEPDSVQTVVTSPPYWGLRDYGVEGQLGAERTVEEYVDKLVALFASLKPAVRDDGTVWLNLGDTHNNRTRMRPSSFQPGVNDIVDTEAWTESAARGGVRMSQLTGGLKEKDLVGVPWLVAFALRADGWYLRSDNIWSKPNPMPESVTDRTTKSHEHVFLLSKSKRYYFDADAIAEDAVSTHPSGNGYARPERLTMGGRGQSEPWTDIGGKRNARDVWTVPTLPFAGAHFAVFPPEIPRRCILAGSREGDMVLDPFSGSGTTGMVALQHGRRYVGIDLNKDYLDLSLRERFQEQPLDLGALA